MKKLMQIKGLVLQELKVNPETRRSDYKLFLAICKKLGVDVSAGLDQLIDSNRLPSYESITRARRKIQAEHTGLRDDETAEIRAEHEDVFREFAKTATA